MKRVCALMILVATAGCGGGGELASDRPETVTASGVLTHKGQPVEGATIVLSPTTPGADAFGASAVTTSGGEFSLSSFPPDEGAVPGSYNVSVTKMEATQQKPAAEGSHDEAAPPPPKHLLPEKYADPTKSGVKLEIPQEGNEDLKIELQ